MTPASSPKRGTQVPTDGVALASHALDVVPFNPRHLDEAREHWLRGDWKALAVLDFDGLEAHPDRARLATVRAAAALQLGDRHAARDFGRTAQKWGCDKALLLAVLLASARHSLGRACAAAGRHEQALEHFRHSLFDRNLLSEARRTARARMDDVLAELSARREQAVRQRKAGLLEGEAKVPGWIADLVSRCLAVADVHEAVDTVLDNVLATPDDRVRFLICLADRFQTCGDKLTGLHYLNTAREYAKGAERPLQAALAKRLVAEGQAAVAMDMVFAEAIAAAGAAGQDERFAQAIAQAYQTVRDAEQERREHGHELLLAYLKLHLPKLRGREAAFSMVEIGTTRENVPGQGSTRKLAEFCRLHQIAFVTVDMDPHNSRVAQRMLEGMQVDFQALTAKGEDYLRERRDPVDFVFLDAYDFDHGKHSELRQSRYVKFLGSRIDEQACHEMHLDCARSVVRLLSPDGVVCVDDTWLEDGRWTAKGTLAVPFLLDHGFELVDARNRAALLRRLPVSQP